MSIQKYHFDSWETMVETAKTGSSTIMQGGRESRTTGYWQDSFVAGSIQSVEFTGTFDNAIELSSNGWIEGADKIKAKLDTVLQLMPAYGQRNVPKLNNRKGTLNRNRYFRGNPKCLLAWEKVDDESISGNIIVPIIYNISASARVNAGVIFDKGSVICALIDQLEKSGRRVDLTVAMGTTDRSGSGQDRIEITVQVKRPNDPLDLDRIAYAVGNGGMLRRIGFSIWEQAESELRQRVGVPNRGYGRCWDIGSTEDNAIVIPSSDLYTFDHSRNQWKAWLKDKLEPFGIEWDIDGESRGD